MASPDVPGRLQTLVDLCNRGSLDLPDGALDRNAVFRLNGVAYEDTLGRPGDPLVRLLARGAGGYRFLLKAVRAALPDARLTLTSADWQTDTAGTLVGSGRLVGRLHTGHSVDEPFEARVAVSASGAITAIDVAIADEAVARLVAARAGSDAR